MIIVLSIILFLLLYFIGNKRGVKSFILFYTSFILIAIYMLLMKWGLNALLTAFIICIIISMFNLFGLNGYNIKTKSSFISVLLVLIIMSLLIILVSYNSSIQGFSTDEIESIGGFSYEINYNMTYVYMGIYLVSVIGTMIDTSMSISSTLNEIHENNPDIKRHELYNSGMNVGKDIMCTTINTLYFAMISFFIGYFLWHQNESLELMLNFKTFIQEVVKLLICIIGSIIIIPVTSYIFSKKVSTKY